MLVRVFAAAQGNPGVQSDFPVADQGGLWFWYSRRTEGDPTAMAGLWTQPKGLCLPAPAGARYHLDAAEFWRTVNTR